jgi:hypothetical protein
MKRKISKLVLVGVLCITACRKADTEIVIQRAQIQQALEAKFPYEKSALTARFRLESPEVYFKDGKAGMKMQCVVSFLGKSINGSVDFDGKIVYKPESKAFFLSDFRLVEMKAASLGLAGIEPLKQAIEATARDQLDNQPIYVFDEDNWKQNLDQAFLKKIEIRGDNVVATFSF